MNPRVGTIDPSKIGVPTDANQVIANLVLLIIAVGGLAFFAMLILGGFKYLTAGGDEKAAASARNTLTQAFIGLIIIVSAFVITGLIFSIFNIGVVEFF